MVLSNHTLVVHNTDIPLELLNKANSNIFYASLKIPTLPEHAKVLSTRIKIDSHDQGWSSFPQYRNTREQSYTWGELAVTVSEEDSIEGLCDGSILLIDNQLERVINGSTRLELFRNLHANRDWETHHFETKALNKILKSGDVVWIIARSCYPGWSVSVKDPLIQVEFEI